MWHRRESSDVTCIACGDRVSRTEAREYDKHGDRWDRADKEFEHLCKPCHRELCHQPRAGLESLLEGIDTGGISRERFLTRFADLVDGESDAPGSREREGE